MRSTAYSLAAAALAAVLATTPRPATADSVPALPDEVSPQSDTYHQVYHFDIVIDAPPAKVWQHLLNRGAWTEFAWEPVAGRRGQAGEVVRLYEDQEFYMQTIEAIPARLHVMAALPSLYRDEYATGLTVLMLHPGETGTVLSMVLHQRYVWQGRGANLTRELRQSASFEAATRAAWQERYLPALKRLAESP